MSGLPAAFTQLIEHMMGGRDAPFGASAKPFPSTRQDRVQDDAQGHLRPRRYPETGAEMLAMLESGLDIRKVIIR